MYNENKRDIFYILDYHLPSSEFPLFSFDFQLHSRFRYLMIVNIQEV